MVKAAENLVEEVQARLQLRHSKATSQPQNDDCHFQERVVEALTDSTQSLFVTMCGFEISPTGVEPNTNNRTQYELNGIISISGKLKVSVVLSLSEQLVFSVVKAFLGSTPTRIDADVIDVVGELTNMICGNAKERLNLEGLSLGLPTVVAGTSTMVAFESGLKTIRLGFASNHGSMSILFGIRS